MSKLAILVVVLLGLAYFIDAREERLFFGRRQNVRRWKNKRQDVGVQVVGSQVSTGSSACPINGPFDQILEPPFRQLFRPSPVACVFFFGTNNSCL